MEKEIIIKESSGKKSDFKVVQKGDIIESVNNLNQIFHFMDLAYTKHGIWFHGWVGYRTNDQIKDVLDGHFIELYEQYNCKNMVIETTNMSGSFTDLNEWLANYFMPKMTRSGLKNCAVILPQNIFAQLAVEDWDKKVGGFKSRNFETLQDGLTWLRQA